MNTVLSLKKKKYIVDEATSFVVDTRWSNVGLPSSVCRSIVGCRIRVLYCHQRESAVVFSLQLFLPRLWGLRAKKFCFS